MRLWDLTTGRQASELTGHAGSVRALAFPPDGRVLATVGYDEHEPVRLWDVSTGRRLGKLIGPSGSVHTLAFSPDGRLLATGDADTYFDVEEDDYYGTEVRVRLWDLTSHRQCGEFTGHLGQVNAVAFSPDRRLLATCDGVPRSANPGRIRLWDVPSGRQVGELPGGVGGVKALAFSPDGRLLATGTGEDGQGGQAQVWEVSSGRRHAGAVEHIGPVAALAFSPDGGLLASGDCGHGNSRGEVHLSDPATGHRRGRLTGRLGHVTALAFSPDGRLLATGAIGAGVQLWTVPSGEEVRTLDGTWFPHSLAFSPDGRFLATADATRGPAGRVQLWEVSSGRQCGELVAHTGAINTVAYSPDGHLLAGGDEHGLVRLWNAATHTLIATVAEFEDGWAVLLPDGHYKLTGDPGGHLWWVMNLHRFEPCQIDGLDPSVRRLDPEAPLPGLDHHHR